VKVSFRSDYFLRPMEMAWEERNKTNLSGNGTESAEEKEPLLQPAGVGVGDTGATAISSYQTTTFIRARKPARFVLFPVQKSRPKTSLSRHE
jgi:hypothetical protein